MGEATIRAEVLSADTDSARGGRDRATPGRRITRRLDTPRRQRDDDGKLSRSAQVSAGTLRACGVSLTGGAIAWTRR